MPLKSQRASDQLDAPLTLANGEPVPPGKWRRLAPGDLVELRPNDADGASYRFTFLLVSPHAHGGYTRASTPAGAWRGARQPVIPARARRFHKM